MPSRLPYPRHCADRPTSLLLSSTRCASDIFISPSCLPLYMVCRHHLHSNQKECQPLFHGCRSKQPAKIEISFLFLYRGGRIPLHARTQRLHMQGGGLIVRDSFISIGWRDLFADSIHRGSLPGTYLDRTKRELQAAEMGQLKSYGLLNWGSHIVTSI
jgi:hypothetical protein